MTQSDAKQIVINLVRDHLHTLPTHRQAEVYEAMSLLLPTESERQKAEHLAWILSEAVKHQLDLFADMQEELSWPGHQHNGDSKDGGRQ